MMVPVNAVTSLWQPLHSTGMPALVIGTCAPRLDIMTMVKPGGRLVYATCSLEPEENEHVIAAFLAERRDFGRDAPAAFALPLDPDGTLRCVPHRHGTDGFTAVRLRRTA